MLRTKGHIVPTNYVIHQQNIEKNRMFQTHTHKNGLLAIMYSCFSSFWFSGRYKKNIYVSDAKVQKFRLARSARSQPLMGFSRVSGRYKSSWTRPYNECYEHKDTLYRQTMWFTNTILRRIACFRHTQKMACSQIAIIYSFFSSFLFLMNKTILRVLRTQSWTYCTDKQWLISNVYIEIWESYVFNADITKSARSLRSLAILYTFSPVSNASSFNKAISWTY